MGKEELLLKTIFCCIACDGDIVAEEINMVINTCTNDKLFSNIDVEKCLNSWVSKINEKGALFLQTYLKDISSFELNEQEQLLLVSLAIKAIEADNRIDYTEVKFFKKIRARLSISDEIILSKYPDKEDFLLPDINVSEAPIWNDNTHFSQLSIPIHTNPTKH